MLKFELDDQVTVLPSGTLFSVKPAPPEQTKVGPEITGLAGCDVTEISLSLLQLYLNMDW